LAAGPTSSHRGLGNSRQEVAHERRHRITLDSYIALELCFLMAWRMEEYRTAGGETPVRTFIAGLPVDAKAEAIALIKLAETLGNKLREPQSKALGDGLFELRRNQVRLFYTFEPGQIIRLLGGMVKKQDRIPVDVLAQMRGYQKDARERVKKAKTEKKG